MNNMLEYKGYTGSVRYSAEDRVFFGKVEHIRSLITFEGTDVDTLELSFKDAINDYLESCRDLGRPPEKPFKGVFNVRTDEELHRRASIYASTHNRSLNQVVNEALAAYLRPEATQASQDQDI